MTKIFYSLSLVLAPFFICSCKKDKANSNDCFPNVTTTRTILNKPATIKLQPGGVFYIVEQGTIDTKLNPCNLTTEFKVDNLQVTITGEVKATIQGGPGPCCTDDFYITKISK